ncbi:MAG TPA: MAPEG family protein [Alphaproteobacteria bacterium]|jgi:hypothetical protein|nr:MAPEG family protein [Alphaproteobacteria bacterium]
MALDGAQRGVLRGMMSALVLSLVLLLASIVWQPAFLVPLAPPAERLAATLRWDAAVLACLILAIGSLARHRFFTPADIDGSGLTTATEHARVLQAVLHNTLEQAVIAVLAHLLWSVATPPGWQAAIPVAVLLFVIGRACFALRYSAGAAARAFGFALTFYPTVILTVIALGTLLVRGGGGAA